LQAVLILPDDALFAANLVDRPFLRHVVDFIATQGIRSILVWGRGTEQARRILGAGVQWDATIVYQEAHTAADFSGPLTITGDKCLLASALCLPRFPLQQGLDRPGGLIVYGGNQDWTGWALMESRDVAAMPSLSDRAAVLSYLQGLANYESVSADAEFRCGGAEDIWRAHQTALGSQLSLLFHAGLDTKPGIWMGRNASVAASAVITAPAYIGENSRIGPGAQIGPFAVIARDCLIAPQTIVRHSVIAPDTYAGNNLELDHVFVNQRELFDIRFGVSVEDIGFPVVDRVFDFHWSTIPRQVYSAALRGLSAVPSVLSSAWSGLKHALRDPVGPIQTQRQDTATALRIRPHNDPAPDQHRRRSGGIQ
jgi:hypothetical protein